MKVYQKISGLVKYILEGFNEIFRPNDKDYPAIGVQPFESESASEWVDLKQ